MEFTAFPTPDESDTLPVRWPAWQTGSELQNLPLQFATLGHGRYGSKRLLRLLGALPS